MPKVLITGADGYIGGSLVDKMRACGWEVSGLVREHSDALEVEQTVCDLATPEAPELLERACAQVATVVHLAGENEVFAAQAPAAALAATVVATERVAEACVRAGTSRLLYMSTVHVYGERIAPGATLREEMRVEPRSAYAISRLASEHAAAALARDAYELVTFRLTNSVGAPWHPGVDRWTLVANDLCRQGALGGRLELRSSGTQWRDFVSLDAVCGAVELASRCEQTVVPAGTYNLGSGQPTTVRALAETVQECFARETGERPPLLAPEPEPDPPAPYYVSVQRALDQGLHLEGGLEEAVAQTVRFCLDHKQELVR